MAFLCCRFDFDVNEIMALLWMTLKKLILSKAELIDFQRDDELRRKAPKKDEEESIGENLILFWHAVMKERFPVLKKKHANRLICVYMEQAISLITFLIYENN